MSKIILFILAFSTITCDVSSQGMTVSEINDYFSFTGNDAVASLRFDTLGDFTSEVFSYDATLGVISLGEYGTGYDDAFYFRGLTVGGDPISGGVEGEYEGSTWQVKGGGTGNTCTGKCGCTYCKFKSGDGCSCEKHVVDPGCQAQAHCTHTVTTDN